MFANIVVLQPDARLAQSLSSALRPYFLSVVIATTVNEFRDAILANRPRVAVLELESSMHEDLGALRRDFPALAVVCTHRLPDDEMWRQVLEAGGSDVCATYDPASVVRSVLQSADENSAAA